jgi:hypothetical protein
MRQSFRTVHRIASGLPGALQFQFLLLFIIEAVSVVCGGGYVPLRDLPWNTLNSDQGIAFLIREEGFVSTVGKQKSAGSRGYTFTTEGRGRQ